ncbi:MAG: glycosyltransferase family 2 protein [Nitrospirae bacterium]|nr:glycosyltransferase family 2 protein [Candidatus Manganitrophaceae bacterium]
MINNSISIVLPNYNGKELLEENLPSLYQALKNFDFPYKIIVVDDCSTDDSVPFLRSKYPEVAILQNKVNAGFSETCNKGIQYAQSDLICVSNTDVTFHKDYFIHAKNYFKNPKVFAVKGDIINYAGQKDQVINVDKTARLYYKRGLLRFKTHDNFDQKPYDLEYVGLGCCFIANTAYLQKLGGFDTIFSPYYWEDSDLALTAIEQGYELIYEPKSIVYHKTSSTMDKTQSSLKRKIISNRNKFLFCWKHLKGRKRWINHVSVIVISLLTRFLVLDWKFYYTLTLAIMRTNRFRRLNS